MTPIRRGRSVDSRLPFLGPLRELKNYCQVVLYYGSSLVMTDLESNIKKLQNKNTKDAFKVYVYNKIGSMPSDVTINSWVSNIRQPSHIYTKFISDFFK